MKSRFKQILQDLAGALAICVTLLAGTAVKAHANEVTVLPKMIGCTADGYYRVFGVQGQPGDVLYQQQIRGQWYQWTDIDLYNNLPHVRKEDVDGTTYRCDQSVCFTADGYVIGAAPLEH
jgi:hypothetical protein